MAGIKTLKELYDKLGKRELRKLLQSEIKITEKFDTYRFSFEKNSKDYTVYYYGKNGKVPLSKIERTLSDIYEGAIAHINNLPSEIVEKFPARHRFGFSWFPQESPHTTQYERRPKSGLILTDISIRDSQSGINREINNIGVLESWAKLLRVECAKPIYEGKLDEETVNNLLESVKTQNDYLPLFENYGLKSHLNENIPAYNNLVFETDNRLFKITEGIKSVSEKRSHLLDLLLMDILESLDNFNILGISVKSKNFDESYIEAICEMFNYYVKNNGEKYLDLGIKKPDFLEKNGSLNTEWIQNSLTKKILESNRDYEYLFGIFLANLRKPKSQSGLLNESLANKFNEKIEQLNQVIGNDYSFLEFSSLIKESISEEELPLQKSEPDYVKSVNLLTRFFDGNRTFEPGKEKINIILCNAGFLTHKIKEEAEAAFKSNGLKSILVHSQDLLKKNIGISPESVKKMLKQYVSDNNDFFIDYKIVDQPLLHNVINCCRPDYEPTAISVGFTSDAIRKELNSFYAIFSDENSNLKRQIKISQFKDKNKDKIYKSIEDDSIKSFYSMTPSAMHPYWTEIKKSFSTFTYINI